MATLGWTPEAERYLAARLRAGDSLLTISKGLEEAGLGTFSRSAVSGKVTRLGLRDKPTEAYTAREWPTNNQAHRFCQWPLWGHKEKPNGRFCRKPVYGTRAYCADHCAVAFNNEMWR